MENRVKARRESESGDDEQLRIEIESINAMLRHFRGVAASVMNDALKLWEELWEACQDPRTCTEILEGTPEPGGQRPSCGWQEFMEKLHVLGSHIDYAKKLCSGSIINDSKDESEVQK
jgi:hypothetical protein